MVLDKKISIPQSIFTSISLSLGVAKFASQQNDSYIDIIYNNQKQVIFSAIVALIFFIWTSYVIIFVKYHNTK